MQPQHGAISFDGLETKVGRLVVLVAYKLVVVGIVVVTAVAVLPQLGTSTLTLSSSQIPKLKKKARK